MLTGYHTIANTMFTPDGVNTEVGFQSVPVMHQDDDPDDGFVIPFPIPNNSFTGVNLEVRVSGSLIETIPVDLAFDALMDFGDPVYSVKRFNISYAYFIPSIDSGVVSTYSFRLVGSFAYTFPGLPVDPLPVNRYLLVYLAPID